MQQNEEHVVIIGNGIAGITLAQRLRARTASPVTIISDEAANHFSRPALMYVYMGHMRYQDIVPYPESYWQEKQISLIHDRVVSIDFENRTLNLRQGQPVKYSKLVLAVGSSAVYYNWPGQNYKGVQSLITLQDLELMQQQTIGLKEAVIVGGGLIGIEMAEMLQSKGIAVTVVVRESLYWRSNLPTAEASLVTEHIQNCGIKLLLSSELKEITGDEKGNVTGIRLTDGREVRCQFVGIATGVKPNTAFLEQSDIETDKGILINHYFETSIPDVYAIGDCAQFKEPAPGEPALEQLWYTGRQHAETLAETLTGKRKRYERGPWFNSAKFLNMEYQTYGFVPRAWDEQQYDSLYWQHSTACKAIRILYEQQTGQLKGINLLGIRYRHDLCHTWLQQKYTIHQVMQELKAANFDPEFAKRYEPALLEQYYFKFPDHSIEKKETTWWKLRKLIPSISKTTENC